MAGVIFYVRPFWIHFNISKAAQLQGLQAGGATYVYFRVAHSETPCAKSNFREAPLLSACKTSSP
jgi:hypothetical protein